MNLRSLTAAALGAAICLPAVAARADPLVFVYEGAGCTGAASLPAFEQLIGRKVDGVSDFVPRDSWTDAQSEMSWATGCWKGKGYKLALAVPMVMDDQDPAATLKSGATGSFNAQYAQLARTLVSSGFPDAYIRLGWEFNGNWYRWYAGTSTVNWIAYYRQAVAAMRSVPGAAFKFVWNPNIGSQQTSPSLAYPGDDVVDLVGLDAYNASWVSGYTDPTKRWNDILNQTWGLAQVASFAASHKKPVSLPEWGTGTRADGHGGGDDPLYVTNVSSWLKLNNAAYAGYWDYNSGDYNAKMSTGAFPNSAKALKSALAVTPSGPPLTASASDGATVAVTANPDGSAVLKVSFPTTSSRHHYTIWLSQSRAVETWGEMSQLGWDTTGGTATIHVGAR